MGKILFDALIEKDNKVWFIPLGKTLSYIDLATDEFHIIPMEERMAGEAVIGQIVEYKNKLIWVSQDGVYLRMYDIDEKKYHTYILPEMIFRDWRAVSLIFVVEDHLYIVPKYSAFIISFDLLAGKPVCIGLKNDLLANEDIGIYEAIYYANRLFFIFDKKMTIIEYDMLSRKCEEYHYQCAGDMKSVFTHKNEIHMLINNQIIMFNMEKGNFISSGEIHCGYPLEGKLISTENKFFIFPRINEEVFVIDRTSLECESYRGFPEDFFFYDFEWRWVKFMEHAVGQQYIWLNNRSANYIFRINIQNETLECYRPQNYDALYFMIEGIKKHCVVWENDAGDLEQYLEIVEGV